MIIIGTGAVAAEITMFFPNVNGYLEYPENKAKYYDRYFLNAPILGTIDDYEIKENDRFVLGVANIDFRNKVIKTISDKGGKFINLIHHTVLKNFNFEQGIGNVISPFCLIDPMVKIGSFNLFTAQTAISHDCILGDNNFISSSVLCGHVNVGNNNYFGVHSCVIPEITIGNNNTIAAGITVRKNIGDNSIVISLAKELISPK